jgi:hypothetical protein
MNAAPNSYMQFDWSVILMLKKHISKQAPMLPPAKLIIENLRIFGKRNFPGNRLLYDASDNKMSCKYLRFFFPVI